MQVTGYTLQSKIRTLKTEVDSYATQFANGTAKFADEEKLGVKEAYQQFDKAERKLARLQTAQTIYNLRVKVNVLGERMTLCEAIKRVGGAGRAEAMWKGLVAPKKDRYSRDDSVVRDKDKEYASKTYTLPEAQAQARNAASYASALRAAIQEANATSIEIPDSELA